MVDPATIRLVNPYTESMFASMLRRLLPRGPLWERLQGPVFTALLETIAAEFVQVEDGLASVFNECIPETAVDLDRWAEALGVTRYEDETDDQIRVRCATAYRRGKKATESWIESVVSDLGYTVAVSMPTAGHRLVDVDEVSPYTYFTLDVSRLDIDPFEGFEPWMSIEDLVRRFTPGWMTLEFSYQEA